MFFRVINMDSTHDAPQKDIWDKISASSGIVAAILVPIAVAFVGAQYSAAVKERELDISSKREYIQIGLSILRDATVNDNVRQWGMDIINHYADVPMPPATQQAFTTGGQILPPPSQDISNATNTALPLSATGRVAQMDALQTQGITALLDRRLDEAMQAYSNAYKLWPEFRNVDEIRRLLDPLKSPPPHTDQEWKQFYQKIATFDLRGVDQKIKDRLKQKSR
jgi:hypothetical protein